MNLFTLGWIVGAAMGFAFGVAVANRTRTNPAPPPLHPIAAVPVIPRESNVVLLPTAARGEMFYNQDEVHA